MNDEYKNLKEQLTDFLTEEQADQALRDIEQGDKIIAGFDSPAPDDDVLARVKARVNATISRRHSMQNAVLRVASVAAVFFLLATLAVWIFRNNLEPSLIETMPIATMSTRVWDGNDITVDDDNISTLTAEIDQIERELWAIQMGEAETNGDSALYDLEIELIEESDSFWKG